MYIDFEINFNKSHKRGGTGMYTIKISKILIDYLLRSYIRVRVRMRIKFVKRSNNACVIQ